jgi:phage terminase large subunit
MPEIHYSRVFRETAIALKNAYLGTGPRLIINEGGQGSSKTYSACQALFEFAHNSPDRMKLTMCSYAFPHLKRGVLSDFENTITANGLDISEVRRNYEYHIGNSIFDCYGVEGNMALAHGPRRTIIFINEVNRKINYEVFDQLFSRSQVTLVDYNPDRAFWLQEKVLPIVPHVLIKSNFLDNAMLPKGERDNILMKMDKPGYENWWRVYGLGLMGTLEGAIFKNWRYGEFDKSLPFGYGLDFGFTDPDALTKVALDHKRKIIYCEELLYKSGNSTDALRELLFRAGVKKNPITADCEDARTINTLSDIFNIQGVNKAIWTVNEAIKEMQGWEIVITEDSTNLGHELTNYLWGDGAKIIPVGPHHLIDGVRYRFMTEMNGSSSEYFFSKPSTNDDDDD